MSEAVILGFAGLAGGVLGAIFFGGLWWTVRRGLPSPRAALWFLASGALRLSLVMGGFSLIGGGQWGRLVAGLVGFTVARLAVTARWRAAASLLVRANAEASHAP